MSEDKRWIYKSRKCGFKVNIKPTTNRPLIDGSGNAIKNITEGPVFLRFDTPTAIIDDMFVERTNRVIHADYTAEDYVKMVETCTGYGTEFFLAQSPTMIPDAELAEKIKESDALARKRGPKTKQGVRSTADLG